ncbi:MAG: hypothetical protein ABIN57_11195 [Chitinophagaceae bacterium]
MNKFHFAFLIIILSTFGANAQDGMSMQKGKYVRQQALGISFVLNDYTTAQRIRSRSLASVIDNKQLSKINQMSPGLAVTYFRGLQDNIDFAGTLSGSFVDDPRQNAPSSTGFLTEADASVQFKLLSDQYLFTPYVSAGVGASRFENYYGAIMPLGAGLKVNLFDEAAIFLNAQYRIPITTETNSYHFFYNLGIAGIIGKKK